MRGIGRGLGGVARGGGPSCGRKVDCGTVMLLLLFGCTALSISRVVGITTFVVVTIDPFFRHDFWWRFDWDSPKMMQTCVSI